MKFKALLKKIREEVPRRGLHVLHFLLRMPIAIGLVLCSLVVILGSPSFDIGEYLDEYLWYEPIINLRHDLGLTPPLDPTIRVILNEDFTVGKLKRPPTFAEWTVFANHLKTMGYEKIMFYGGPEFTFEEANPGATKQVMTAAAVVDVASPSSMTTEEIESLEALLLPGDYPDAETIDIAMTLPKDLHPYVQHIGHINQVDRLKIQAFYRTNFNKVAPYMGFWAADGLQLTDGRLQTAKKEFIPISSQGDYYVNYIAFYDFVNNHRDQLTFALKFFDRGTPRKPFATLDKIPQKTREILEGGKIAIIIADSTQLGTRWINSPVEGNKVPTYTTFISVINSIVTGRHMRVPLPRWLTILFATGAIFGLLLLPGSKRSLIFAGSAIAALALVNAFLLAFQDIYLPGASITAIGLAGYSVRFAYHFVTTVKEQATLSQQLELGSTVQSLLMPSDFRGTVGSWEYKVVYQPYGPMAGDWVQLFTAEEVPGFGPVGILAIGDVVGKGPSAALNTAVIANVWKEHASHWEKGTIDAEGFFHALNQAIYRTFGGKQNTTLSLVILEPNQATFLCASAPKWHHISPGENHKKVMTKAHNPVGFFDAIGKLPVKVVVPRQGDLFLAYTDGVIDDSHAEHHFRKEINAHNFSGEVETDFHYLEKVAVDSGKDSALPDDITMLLIKRTAPVEEESGVLAG